jgi:hypothetical protein
LYEGQFIMALATTSSVWRSTGGDQTRTAYSGSMVMAAQFYIANTAATSNVVVSSASGAPALILPAGAVVTEVIISGGAGGNSAANIGFTPIVGTTGPGQSPTLGTNVPQAFVAAGNVAARTVFTAASATGGASLGNVANSTNLIVITSAQGSAGANAGAVTGDIIYYVADSLAGQQNV